MSLMTREDVLRELELLPVWQLRQQLRAATKASGVVESSQPTEMALAEEIAMPITESAATELTNHAAQIQQMNWEDLQQYIAHLATRTLRGFGDSNADWLIVGEASESDKGELFAEQETKLLDNMLAAIQVKRGNGLYITGMFNSSALENHQPENDTVTQFVLKRQVELMQPKLMIALGDFAAQSLLQTKDSVANLRGKLHSYNNLPVIVTYHPADLLRNSADKAKAWQDLCLAKKTMQSFVDVE